tara:strand:+ start:1032 stop:1799 length:768 start_codon:yes stop_codon:yes gene_type:complete
MILVKRWNRFGNSIIQLQNILHIALYLNETIKENIQHEFFDINRINDILNNDHKDNIIEEKHNFFVREVLDYPKEVFTTNIQKVQQILEESFIIKDIPKLNENDYVIHIRTGDIFDENPHPKYIMPPFSYYKNIIENTNYNKIIIIAEDTKNPTINKLLKEYPNIDFKIQSFYKDIQTILGATNIISSFGTFIPYLALLSKNIKNLYQPEYQGWYGHFKHTHVNVYKIELPGYYEKMHPWKNTPEQIDVLLNYNI